MHRLTAGLFWLVLGVLFSSWATTYRLGSLIQPGPGFFPLVLGSLLIFFSVLLIVFELRNSTTDSEAPMTASLGTLFLTVVVLLVAIFSFERLGYLITLFFLIVFLMLINGSRNWKTILLSAILTSIALYVFFERLLGQSLPHGVLRIETWRF